MEFTFKGTSGLGDVRRLTVSEAGVELRTHNGTPVGLETSFRDAPRLRTRLMMILRERSDDARKRAAMLDAMQYRATGRVWQVDEQPAAADDALALLADVLDQVAFMAPSMLSRSDAVRRAHDLLVARGLRQPLAA